MVLLFVIVGASVSYWVATKFGSVFEAFQTFLSFFQGSLLALLLLGMLWPRGTQWGGLAGMLIGVVTAAVLSLSFGVSFLWVAWWSFVAATAGVVFVSLVTKPYHTERLRGLVCWIPIENS